jgi:xylose dehydrogenase (NAD/NADP)
VPGTIFASFGVSLGNGYTVAGPEGILSVSSSFNQNGGGDLVWQGQVPVMVPTMHEVDPYTMEVEHFSACIQNDARPAVDPRDSMDDVRVMMAIYESAKTGCKVSTQG